MKKVIVLLVFFLFPIGVFAEELIPNSKSGLLIEASTGKILYEKNKDDQLSVASMTKMVAQIIILKELRNKKINLDDIVTASRNASGMGGSQIYLEEGEKMNVSDLLKGISVASGNDATVAMAEFISGSEEKFVERMNKEVERMGLKNTHFENCTGLDSKNHYSSAYDMAMIAKELVTNYPEILNYSSIYEDYLRKGTSRKFWLVNTNKLIRQYEGTDGLKTGHTDDAGYCIATTAKRGDIRLIGIVLGEKDSKVRNKEAMELMDYGFSNVKVKKLKNQGEIIKKISFKKGKPNYTIGVLDKALVTIEDSGSNSNYKLKEEYYDAKLPIKKGDILGKVDALLDKKIVSSSNIISNSDVSMMSLFDYYISSLKNVITGVF